MDKGYTRHYGKIIRIWDLPTRLFHWSLVILLFGLWYTSRDVMTLHWHMWLGYALIALLLFRILWGVMGTRSVRFSDFLAGPVTVFQYFKGLFTGDGHRHPGHNPMGGWAVMIMLGLLMFQSFTGLFANDQIFNRGPFARMVSSSTSDWLTGLHKLNFDLILIMVGIHVTAVLLYWLLKRDNLILPMITGRKRVTWYGAEDVKFANVWWAVLLLAVCSALVWAGITYIP
ncbi:cytochrome b/b6 domain-containing protein [Ectothiorhodospira shaposhnikovii]|uniref:cytochrome b/b6 domain-containing protein n=1 Tax=Ectothiorhodospira shaposhnikovii TaxID=1054 RepID=UPI00399FAB0A